MTNDLVTDKSDAFCIFVFVFVFVASRVICQVPIGLLPEWQMTWSQISRMQLVSCHRFRFRIRWPQQMARSLLEHWQSYFWETISRFRSDPSRSALFLHSRWLAPLHLQCYFWKTMLLLKLGVFHQWDVNADPDPDPDCQNAITSSNIRWPRVYIWWFSIWHRYMVFSSWEPQ